ncbi:MAG: hypothetical protein KDD01_10335 [Phaeodactylibacter sp.]|nr:hypothetical protein [Phaeodactylibacter sp.]
MAVCHNLRINSNRVFKDIAKRGKTSTGYFYGLKIHLVINDIGGQSIDQEIGHKVAGGTPPVLKAVFFQNRQLIQQLQHGDQRPGEGDPQDRAKFPVQVF